MARRSHPAFIVGACSSRPPKAVFVFTEADLLPLSGLQHLAFCERQWALIHIEQAWAENRLTAEGKLIHEHVDEVRYETRDGKKLVRALPLHSLRLGISGRADLVEFPGRGSCPADGSPVPIEYKRGRAKHSDIDEVQVCAQALCLEEMLDVSIQEGLIYYHQTRHRISVPLIGGLRMRVESLAARMHALFRESRTPKAERMPKCRSCSLVEICQPQWLGKATDPWLRWKGLVKQVGGS